MLLSCMFVAEKKIDDFRCKLGFWSHDITMSKEESVTKKYKNIFKQKNTTTTLSFKLPN